MLDAGTREFIRRLPKTETHLHIEGALPFELLQRLDPQRFSAPPRSWEEDFRFRDFAHFEAELLDMAMSWYTSPERYFEAARVIFQRLKEEQNVKYVECSFASGVLEFLGVDGRAVSEALRAAAPEELSVRVFLGIHHNGWTDRSRGFLAECLSWPLLEGLDLHGTETLPLEAWTGPLWREAREAGKFNKAHAGEFCGPDFVRLVLDELQVTRLEHGVRSVEDPGLVRELTARGVSLDVCPISNVKLGVAPSIEEHPLRALLKEGVTCTVSTDDPVSFGNTLQDEYENLAARAGFSRAELVGIARNGFRVARMSDEWKAPFLAELDALEQETAQ